MAKVDWADVLSYFENNGSRCDTCSYAKRMSESHPYGMGSATENWTECTLLEHELGNDPADCPGMLDLLNEPTDEEDA